MLNGFKTIIAVAGLIGLAAYQLSQGEIETAFTTLMGALGLAGIRHAIARSK